MRLFLIGWGGARKELINTVLELKKSGHEICYWVRSADDFRIDEAEFPDTIFHDHYAALAGTPAPQLSGLTFPQLGEEFLNQFAETESVVLTMMNKKFGNLSVDERKHFYYHLISYWYGVVQKFSPSAIIFPVTPHTVYDYIIYALAKQSGIKTVMFDFTRVNDRVLAMNDFISGCTKLEQALISNTQPRLLTDLSPDVLSYYQTQIGAHADPTPPDTKKVVGKNRFGLLLKLKVKAVRDGFANGSIFKNALNYFAKFWSDNLKKEYLAVQTTADFSKKYIYVPLNYQPEASTSPLGGRFVDQILMIDLLAAELPSGWEILVKEHPYQWIPRGLKFFDSRYRGFYRAIAKIKSVRLVPLKTDTYNLIEHSIAVATVTGTAGWEALLRSKPVVIFGYPWFRSCPGVLKANDAISTRAALAKIAEGFKPSQNAVINYLFHFDKNSFRGYLDAYGKEISTLPETDNQVNFTNAILAELKKI